MSRYRGILAKANEMWSFTVDFRVEKKNHAQFLGLFDHLNLDETTDINNGDILIWSE